MQLTCQLPHCPAICFPHLLGFGLWGSDSGEQMKGQGQSSCLYTAGNGSLLFSPPLVGPLAGWVTPTLRTFPAQQPW